ncbi:MAG: N-acetylmuramic acid 6-phosphate etherase [Solobacterium sp.]|jgi:N-acetylmuramic acid 6-phosphate etherase|nr:N-acetylmuramic acid 6-phosphate etherase [Solobacterium sp.]
MVDLKKLHTEAQNPKTMDLDQMSIAEFLEVMNEEDRKTADAVREQLPEIEKAIQCCIQTIKKGGHIYYMGAGTSGRIGVMDAVECQPTFSSSDFVALMAGGEKAFVKAKEGAEDSARLGKKDLIAQNISSDDTIIGIAASGRTPYVIGGLDYASSIGAETVSIACNRPAEIARHSHIAICVDAGPEVLTGSTRLKAGTCQKMICNMISTGTMIGIGKVYGNLMVDMKATNDKLQERAIQIVMKSTNAPRTLAAEALEHAEYSCKTAIVMILKDCECEEAKALLAKADGFVRKAIETEE